MTSRKPRPYLRKTLTDSLQKSLENVTTTSEAALQFGYSRRQISQFCDEGLIAARKSGGYWLISRQSLETFLRLKRDNRFSPN